MTGMTRRDFTRLAMAGGAALGQEWSSVAIAQGAAKVVIIGGGAGGATVAHYLKSNAPRIDVTLIEVNPIYSTAFFSNLYIGGLRPLDSSEPAVTGGCSDWASRLCMMLPPMSTRSSEP